MYNFLSSRIIARVAGGIVVPGVAPPAKIPQKSPADLASYAGYRNFKTNKFELTTYL